MEWEEFKKELLKDPEFKKEYEKLEPGYKIIRQILSLKKDIETLRRILGHSDISTTTIYITLANIDVENGMKSFKGFV